MPVIEVGAWRSVLPMISRRMRLTQFSHTKWRLAVNKRLVWALLVSQKLQRYSLSRSSFAVWSATSKPAA